MVAVLTRTPAGPMNAAAPHNPLDPFSTPLRPQPPHLGSPANSDVAADRHAAIAERLADDAPRRLLPVDWAPAVAPGRGALAELGPRTQWPPVFTLKQAAAYLQVSETWLEESGIPVARLETTGRSGRALRRWRRKDLDQYIEDHLCHDPRRAA